MTVPLLSVKGASKRFGGLQALDNVSLSVQPGQIHGLIGPNGAGKTTCFNVITGLYQPDSGSFTLNAQPYSPSSPHLVAQAGIARTFQNLRLFGEMTALENVMVGRHVRTRQGVLGAVLRHQAARDEERDIERRAMALLSLVGNCGTGPPRRIPSLAELGVTHFQVAQATTPWSSATV